MAEFVVIAGMSGAGRSQAAKTFEDLGWFVIDNLPVSLLGPVSELAEGPGSSYERVALVVGPTADHSATLEELGRMSAQHVTTTVLFLEASTSSLVRRYESTRRRHPFSKSGRGLAESIEDERQALLPVRSRADVMIDTSSLSVHDLSRRLTELFVDDPSRQGMQISLMSFGFSRGLPRDVDLVLDCRYLPNPHWIEELRQKTGLDAEVREYLHRQPIMDEALGTMRNMLEVLLPAYAREGRAYLSIAFGCTGGQHRSVAMVFETAEWMRSMGHDVQVRHRELGL